MRTLTTTAVPKVSSTLERAHAGGLAAWDLIVVDEAHRVSGRIGKPWAVVHDNQKIPSLRRLYMTATPRLWQLGDEDEAGAPGELVASMEDDPEGPFGSRAFTLTLSEAIDRGICAPYQVVCVDITDTALQAAQLLGAEGRSEQVRGARLAALQTALVKASAEENFRRTLVFHHVVKEAEAFAAGLPGVAAQLHASDPELYPKTIWSDGCAATTSRSTGAGCSGSSRPGSPSTAPWWRSASCAR